MSTQLAKFDADDNAKKPAYLINFQGKVGKNFSVGGFGRNRISLKGNRFRLIVNGQEEMVVDENYLDVIVVGAAEGEKASRIFFQGAYVPGAKTAPSCYSADGEKPAPDVKHPQASSCALCPQNEKGSRTTAEGIKTKACAYFKRLAVVLANDPQRRLFQLDCKGLSLYGHDNPTQNKSNLQSYTLKLKNRNSDVSEFVTRLSFDTESSVPKLLFSKVRFIEEQDIIPLIEIMNGSEVKNLLEINSQTTDSSDEIELPEPKPVAKTATPAQAPKFEVVQEIPVQKVQKKVEPVVAQTDSEEDELAALISKLDAED